MGAGSSVLLNLARVSMMLNIENLVDEGTQKFGRAIVVPGELVELRYARKQTSTASRIFRNV